MATIPTQIIPDGFDSLSSNMSINQLGNRSQMNGIPSSNNNTVINIQSPTGYIQDRPPTPRVININSGNIVQSPNEVQNPRSG